MLEYHGRMHPNFDVMDFLEFTYKYEWVIRQKDKEAKEQSGESGSMSIADMITRMNTGRDD